MIKETKYNGFSAVPADYECPDGDLSLSLGVIPEDGALKPILAPAVKFKLDEGETVVYVHKGNSYVNYIVTRIADNRMQFYTYGAAEFLTLQTDETLTDICAVGNILVISTSLNLYYLYFKDSQYTLLGNELPKPEMSFALSAQLVSTVHKTPLSFSDYLSADNTWKVYSTTTFDTDMIRSSSAAYITATIARDVKINFTKNIEAGTEYKLRTFGSGYTQVYLYAAVSGSSQYELLAAIDNGGEAKIKPAKTYTSFKANVLAGHGGVPSWHANGEIRAYSGFDNDVNGRVIEYNETNYNAVAAAINKFVAEEATNKSLFIYPFFVRYALRLYDGSYARVSEPVLLIPNSGYAPMVSFKQNTDNLTLYSFIASLQYVFLNSIDEKWKDIIAGVDVFASQQAYPYNQGDNFDAGKNLFQYAVINSDSGIDQITGTDYGYCTLPNATTLTQYGYSKHDLAYRAKTILGFGDTDKQADWRIIKLAPVDNQMEKLQQTGSFFLIHSFAFDDITTSEDDFGDPLFQDFKLKDGTLSSLVSRQTLTDDSFSNCRFFNTRLTAYNQRLHLFDFHFCHPTPATPARLCGHIFRYNSYGTLVKVKVFIRTANGERVVQQLISDPSEYSDSMPWFFYPHSKAYKAVLVYKSNAGKYYSATLKLSPHDFLYGAYWMADSLDGTLVMASQSDSDEDNTPVNDTSYYPNSVLQSAVSNPFTFSATMLVTLGVQRILDMASAAKALSQGQFGQFPLYAFTTEGVWALEVSSTGTYSAKQPVTRDVCINSKSITQTDSAVLFATDRGIMLLSGSTTQCLSDTINTDSPFSLSSLPEFDFVLTEYNRQTPADDKLLLEKITVAPFRTFLANCRMIYDYTHQRIVVYNPNYSYAYVFSIDSRQWGMMRSDIQSDVNSYPEALAMDAHADLVDFSSSSADSSLSLVVTRPFKFGEPDLHKTIDTIIQRGTFHTGHVSQLLYGSNNLYSWHVVWSSRDHFLRGFRGTPYKYFRLVLVCNLQKDERIYGFTTSYTPRLTNRPR